MWACRCLDRAWGQSTLESMAKVGLERSQGGREGSQLDLEVAQPEAGRIQKKTERATFLPDGGYLRGGLEEGLGRIDQGATVAEILD